MNVKNNGKSDDLEMKQKFEQEVNGFLDLVDPYQCDKITLSDVIKLFSSQQLETADRKSSKESTNGRKSTNNLNIDLSVQSYRHLNEMEKTQKFHIGQYNATEENDYSNSQ